MSREVLRNRNKSLVEGPFLLIWEAPLSLIYICWVDVVRVDDETAVLCKMPCQLIVLCFKEEIH